MVSELGSNGAAAPPTARLRIVSIKEVKMNKDQIDGAGKVAAGTVKTVAGKLTGDIGLRAEGGVEKLAGHVQGKLGDAEAKLANDAAVAADKTASKAV